jgi:hypothetical protein
LQQKNLRLRPAPQQHQQYQQQQQQQQHQQPTSSTSEMKLSLGGGGKRPQDSRPGVAKSHKPSTVTDLFGAESDSDEDGPQQKRARASGTG